MSNFAVRLDQVSKMYKLYRAPKYRMMEALGMRVAKTAYDEFWPLRDLSLEIKEGERVGLVGRNGAGKSTILKLIANLVQPTEGSVKVKGRVQALMELGTGFHPEFTGRENVNSALAYQGITGRKAKDLLEDVLDFSELEEFIDKPIKTYSAGMYSRLAFAAATAVSPEILIVDEILGAGDAYFAGKSARRMREITAKGATVLFVSHDMSAVQMICNRAIWIERGKIVDDDHPIEVGKKYAASIRKQEEQRLRAVNLKLAHKDTKTVALSTEADQEFTFRFITKTGGAPIHPINFYSIKIFHKDELLETLMIGDAADDDRGQHVHLLTAQGFMNWSEPKRGADGVSYRQFLDLKGKYFHAPFHVGLTHGTDISDEFTIEVSHSGSSNEEVLLQMFGTSDYVTVGKLSKNKASQQFNFQSVANGVSAKSILPMGHQEKEASFADDQEFSYGEGGVAIKRVDFQGSTASSKLVYAFGESFVVSVSWSAVAAVSDVSCVICFYGMDGQCIAQGASPAFNIVDGKNDGSIVADFTPLMVGAGEYAISVGLFAGLNGNISGGNRVLCVHDRQYRIKVVPPENERIERGIVIHPIEWRIGVLDGR